MLFLSTALLLGQLMAPPRPAPQPPAATDCQQRVNHAYEQFEQLQQQRTQEAIVELHFSSGTTYRPPGQKKLTTTTAHFTLLSKAKHAYLSNGDIDLYQDGEVQVSIMRSQQTILITAAQAQLPDAFSRLLQMREQLKTQATITQCALQASKGAMPAQRFIEMRPRPGSAMVGKVTSIAYWLDPRTDALRRMVLYYPDEAGLHSASLEMESIRLKKQDAAVELPALRQVFDSENHLLPVYRSFSVRDQRRR
jgi:hypothetical protein